MLEIGNLQRFFCLVGSERRLSEVIFFRVHVILAFELLGGPHVMEHPRTTTIIWRRVEGLILRRLELTLVLGLVLRVAKLLLFHTFLLVDLFLLDTQILVV